jgi:hypothetical protein
VSALEQPVYSSSCAQDRSCSDTECRCKLEVAVLELGVRTSWDRIMHTVRLCRHRREGEGKCMEATRMPQEAQSTYEVIHSMSAVGTRYPGIGACPEALVCS